MKKLLFISMILALIVGLAGAQTVTVFDSETVHMYPTNLNFDASGNLWIGSDAGFDTVAARVSGDLSTWTYYDTTELRIAELGDDEVYEIGVADNGTACFLTHYGISYMDSEGNVSLVSGSEGTYTKGFVVDGNILYWTYDGTPLAVLYEYDLDSESQVGELYDTDAGMTSGPTHLTVYEGARDAAGQLWLCTHWGVIYEDTGGNWTTLLDGLYPDNLVADPDGNIWVSYGAYPYNDTLVQYNSSGEVLAKYSSADITELGWLNGIVDLETDCNGDVWMVTDSVGVIHFDGSDYTLYNELGSVDLRKNVEDLEIKDGDVWLALYSEGTVAKVSGLITAAGVEHETPVSQPKGFALYQNYPNPFNPMTSIPFVLQKKAQVELAIYDLQGNLVRLLAKEYLPAGRYSRTWDGRNQQGQRVSSGIYIYRLKANRQTLFHKMTYIR